MAGLGWPELIIIGLVLVLLFGAKKLPDTAKALGQSLRLFKRETVALREEDEARSAQSTTVTATAQPAAAQPQPLTPATPSVEERLRLLEEENSKLRMASGQAPADGVPLSQVHKDPGAR